MKLPILLCLAFIYLFTQSFKQGSINREISFICKECQGMEVVLREDNLLQNSPRKLSHSVVDSTGLVKISLNRKDTISLFLQIGKDDSGSVYFIPLYSEPEKKINIYFQNGNVKFYGDLAKVNTYVNEIFKVSAIKNKFISENSAKVNQLSKSEQEAYLEELRRIGIAIDQSLTKDEDLSEYYKNMLNSLNSIDEITQKMSFDINRYSRHNSKSESGSISDLSLSHIFDEFTLNSYLTRNSRYVFLVRQYLEPKFEEILDYYDQNKTKIPVTRYEFVRKIIVNSNKFHASTDLALALLIAQVSFKDGVKYDELLEFTQPFESEFPYTKYLSEVREILADHNQFRSGMPMKDFEMMGVDGNLFNLSNLKDNLLYIDVWATWCVPCRQEFKYSVKLAKKYSERKDIKFVYISVDKKRESWIEFLKRNSYIKGVHGIQSINMVADSLNIMNLYRINGIPRYIIIDKNTKIIDYNAPRPSALLNSTYLDSLLSI